MVGHLKLSLMDDEWVSFVINNGEMAAGPHIVNGKYPFRRVEPGLHEAYVENNLHSLVSIINIDVRKQHPNIRAGGIFFLHRVIDFPAISNAAIRDWGLRKKVIPKVKYSITGTQFWPIIDWLYNSALRKWKPDNLFYRIRKKLFLPEHQLKRIVICLYSVLTF